MADPLVDDLRRIVGASHVLTDADLRAGFERDWTGRFGGTARAVVSPAGTSEVAAVLATCDKASCAVVTQGGNTGLVGGGVPRQGEVVLSTRRLDHVGTADVVSGTLACGAGATLAAVQDAAALAGLAFGVDLGARDSATIGGMVATNAGGVHVLRHGPMADQILGVEAVLADGSIVGGVPALVKDNTGYRWGGILCGSEGTLAVVTEVHLRLVPRLAETAVALVGTGGIAEAMVLVRMLRSRLASLQAVEVFEQDAMDLVCSRFSLPHPFAEAHRAYVLVECAADSSPLPRLAELLAGDAGAQGSAVAEDPAGRSRLWAYRELISDAIAATGLAHKLDVSVPLDAVAGFAEDVRGVIAAVEPDADVVVFGHAGDSNLHVNIVGPAPDADTVDSAVLELVAARGGSVSAEHGIGVAKVGFLSLSRSDADIAAMRRIKRALDPNMILNPGVLFV